MNIVQITPGAGAMHCGLCIRDNALVGALRRLGHKVVMVPLYLPFTLDEVDQSAGTPVFFGGINVYLEQKSAFFRTAPKWLHDLLSSRGVLQWAAGRAAKTRAEDLGELTLSMLRGEEGNQARELNELVAWLKTQPKPDLICLSTGLLIGLAPRLRTEFGARIACQFQGEDVFLDLLPKAQRPDCWKILTARAAEADLLIAPSQYFASLMEQRLGLPAGRIKVLRNGINLAGYPTPEPEPKPAAANKSLAPPVLGFFARMCHDKGLDTLVEAYIAVRARHRVNELKLHIGGSCTSVDEPFVAKMRERLRAGRVLQDVEFVPNPDHAGKVKFLSGLTLFSVPTRYGEAFGLYLIEALAAGVPVLQPRLGAFPELIEATGGGVLCEPGNSLALAEAIENLVLDPERMKALGRAGQRAVFEKFSAEAMARETARIYLELANKPVSEKGA
jgi:glycosyltransferase involved in cell wall biosynthesis